ncbi:MAG: phosphoenolpyruvate hydrolase family protein [bacterium]|nr:phosphoenolpyruvate hydrolase family protein [bacterium]MDE0289494.1 phosphoenolpyruvate hydrolase family protein [bacterium]MDE0438470.1 phosphoenolpyruvate hydrolase family protein [bacterium]
MAGILVAKARRKETIVVAGAGTGLSAKCAEAGGADAVVIYNSGRYRMAGRGSLAGLMPYGDANRIVLEMTREIVTVVDTMPVIAGVCGTDPFRDMGRFLDELAGCGISGVQNFPTVGLIDGGFRRALEATGMSYSAEVDMIGLASRMGMFTMPYVFDAAEASAMADAGADVLVAHVGLTTGGMIGASDRRTVASLAPVIEEICGVADAAGRFIPVLCHGGPISEPSDLAEALQLVPRLNGFVGASSIERLPTESAIVDRVARFRAVRA